MTITSTRKIVKIGDSRGITLPAALTFGKNSTLAADRIVLVDPRGTISEADLLEFLEKQVEPRFWLWLKEKGNNESGRDP